MTTHADERKVKQAAKPDCQSDAFEKSVKTALASANARPLTARAAGIPTMKITVEQTAIQALKGGLG